MPYEERMQVTRRPTTRGGLVARTLAAVRSYTLGPLTSSSPELAKYFSSRAAATGVSVDEVSALTYSAVWAAVSLISDDIASLPLMLYRRLSTGGKDRFETHPLYRLLHDSPNPEMSTMQWRRTMQGHALLWGNGYSEIERDGANRPVAIWPITPDRVTPFRAAARMPLQYRVANYGGAAPTVIDASNMLALPNMSFDGSTGYRVVEKMRESIGLSLAAEQYGAQFFGNGTAFGGIITYDGNPADDVRKNNREALERRHKGVENAHKFLALYGGAKFQSNTTTPDDSQFQELRTFQIREVARWFKLPPHKLADLADATFSNVEQQNLDYYTSCLRPWLELWEQELGRKLIASTERNIQFVEHVADGLLRADAAGRGELYTKQFNVAAITPNEIRNAENRDPLVGGDRAFVALNMIPLDRVDEYVDSLIKAKEPPPVAKPVVDQPPQDTAAQEEIKALTEAIALARRRAQEAEDLRDVALSTLTGVEGERDEARATIATLLQRAVDAQSCLEQVEANYQRVSGEKTTETGRANTALALLEEVRGLVQVGIVERDALVSAALKATDAQARAESDRDREATARQVAEEAAAAIATSASALRARIDSTRESVRGVLVASVGHLLARESDRARKASGTGEKFGRWVDSFYVLHADTCRESLRPAVQAWMAVTGSTAERDGVLDRLVAGHVEASVQQLRAVQSDATADGVGVALDRVLRRWEADRASDSVDRWIREAAL